MRLPLHLIHVVLLATVSSSLHTPSGVGFSVREFSAPSSSTLSTSPSSVSVVTIRIKCSAASCAISELRRSLSTDVSSASTADHRFLLAMAARRLACTATRVLKIASSISRSNNKYGFSYSEPAKSFLIVCADGTSS